jgi:hypothetical protein
MESFAHMTERVSFTVVFMRDLDPSFLLRLDRHTWQIT